MEVGVGGDQLLVLIEGASPLGEDGVEFGDRWKVPVDNGLVDDRPQTLGRLQVRRVGRQIDEANAVRHGQVRFAVPAGIVEHQQDGALTPGAGLAGKVGPLLATPYLLWLHPIS